MAPWGRRWARGSVAGAGTDRWAPPTCADTKATSGSIPQGAMVPCVVRRAPPLAAYGQTRT